MREVAYREEEGEQHRPGGDHRPYVDASCDRELLHEKSIVATCKTLADRDLYLREPVSPTLTAVYVDTRVPYVTPWHVPIHSKQHTNFKNDRMSLKISQITYVRICSFLAHSCPLKDLIIGFPDVFR